MVLRQEKQSGKQEEDVNGRLIVAAAGKTKAELQDSVISGGCGAGGT